MQGQFEGMQLRLENKYTKAAVLGALCTLLLTLNTFALYHVFTSQGEYVIWDFQPLQVAARELLQGKNPYSEEVTRTIQLEAYGRLPQGEEDVHAYAYPLYLAYLTLPLGMIPGPWAQALWLSILQFAVILGSGLVLSIWDWPRRPLARTVVFVWCLLFYPILWGFILGQVALIVFTLVMLGVWATLRGHDRLAGVAFGLAIIKPNLVFLLIPAVLLWGLAHRRWHLVIALGVTMGLLITIPSYFQPGWIPEFINRLIEYSGYSPFPAPVVVVIDRCCSSVQNLLIPIAVALLISGVAYGWWQAIRSGLPVHFLWAAGATLIATTAIAPRLAIVNQGLLLLPAVGVFMILSTKGRWGIAAGLGLGLVWGIGLWLLSWLPPVSTTEPRYPVEHLVLSPLLPLSMALVWWLCRRWLIDLYVDSKFRSDGVMRAQRTQEAPSGEII